MQSKTNKAQILSSQIKTEDLVDPKQEISRVLQDSKSLFISLPLRLTSGILEEALNSKRFEQILVDGPVTLDYFDIQRLASIENTLDNVKIQVNLDLRRQTQIQEFKGKIQEVLSLSSIISLTVLKTSGSASTTPSIETQDIDLLLYLTGQNIITVQGSNNSIGAGNNSIISLLTGIFESGATFSYHLKKGDTETLLMQVGLSSGETLSTVIKGSTKLELENTEAIESLFEAKNTLASLHDVTRALRVLICAQQSQILGRSITLKYIEEGVVPVRTVGTAAFLQAGLFLPVSLNQRVAVEGVYSSKQEQIKTIFNRVASTGEPLEYQSTYQSLISHQPSQNTTKPRPFFYIPSVVLWRDISSNAFGKVKHIRTQFTCPQVNLKARTFDPAYGGAGLDIYCYNLHFTLRVIGGFDQSFEVTQSNIKSPQEYDPINTNLSKIDLTLDTKITFGNGVTADLFATFNPTTILHTEAELFFENGTKILFQEFVHPQHIITLGFSPILIQKPDSPKWEDYITAEDRKHPDYVKFTYDQQVEFVRRLATGEEHYDLSKDAYGLGMEANIKMHEIIDQVFLKGGFEKKIGA